MLWALWAVGLNICLNRAFGSRLEAQKRSPLRAAQISQRAVSVCKPTVHGREHAASPGHSHMSNSSHCESSIAVPELGCNCWRARLEP